YHHAADRAVYPAVLRQKTVILSVFAGNAPSGLPGRRVCVIMERQNYPAVYGGNTMDFADFFAMDRLSEHDEEQLIESAMQLQQVMLLYEAGIREIKTKLDILSDESRISGKPSPIDSIKSRIKTPRSIIG